MAEQPSSLTMPAPVQRAAVPRLTVARAVEIEGTGIHSGAPCRVVIQPSLPGDGITFARPGGAPLTAAWRTANAELSDRRTVIAGSGSTRFEQIEHLMAAFAAMGIWDAHVIQTGPEVPFLDGGSRQFMEKLRAAGTTAIEGAVEPLEITRTVTLEDGDAILVATPDDCLRLSCFVEFPGTVVGSAGFTMECTEERFFADAAPARTFALASDIEKLRAAGLARGGNLDNAVVFDHERYHNESLRFPDEVVRHKAIDLLGDLALLSRPLRGHFWAWRAGHRSHVRFAQLIAKEFMAE